MNGDMERIRRAVEAGRNVTMLMMDGSILELRCEEGRWALVCRVIPTMVYTVRGTTVRVNGTRRGEVAIAVGRNGTAVFKETELENVVVHRASRASAHSDDLEPSERSSEAGSC